MRRALLLLLHDIDFLAETLMDAIDCARALTLRAKHWVEYVLDDFFVGVGHILGYFGLYVAVVEARCAVGEYGIDGGLGDGSGLWGMSVSVFFHGGGCFIFINKIYFCETSLF